jgi:hypothetical protein
MGIGALESPRRGLSFGAAVSRRFVYITKFTIIKNLNVRLGRNRRGSEIEPVVKGLIHLNTLSDVSFGITELCWPVYTVCRYKSHFILVNYTGAAGDLPGEIPRKIRPGGHEI